jgi:hypothetical protein
VAKAVQASALEALAGVLGDPAPRVLHGSKAALGIFPSASAADKAAAHYCLEHGWLAPAGEAPGKGKTRKPLYRLTPAGLQAVLAQSDPTAILKSLTNNLKSLEDASASILTEIQTNSAALRQLKTALTGALERIKPVDVDELTRKMAAPRPVGEITPPATVNWGEEVVRMVAEQRQRNQFQRLTLPQIFERLRSKHPHLTLGQFHDGLRRLQDEKRIRLGPYTQALATLDDPRNALFLDREVKYYVDLP